MKPKMEMVLGEYHVHDESGKRVGEIYCKV